MTLQDWLKKFEIGPLKINLAVLRTEIKWAGADKKAAWDLYVELLTRVATQPLPQHHGDEKTALDSVFSVFGLTRSIMRKNGPECIAFSKIAIIVLNQVIRPFTAKWHRISLKKGFKEESNRKRFRNELMGLQKKICVYAKMLADMAGVEDLTKLEKNESNERKA